MKTLYFSELKLSRISMIIWTAALSFMLAICILIYPEMQAQMENLGNMFGDMGAFSEAFGMDILNLGEFMGYFSVECGETLGLGGALFAAIVGVTALAKEERNRTAEFLLTHPISRQTVVSAKLLSAVTQVTVLDVAAALVTLVCVLALGLEADAGKMALLFLALLLSHIEMVALTFGISAMMRRGEIGAGLGVAFGMYFFNLLANLTEDLEFFKYFTPFGYADGSYIVSEGKIHLGYLSVGLAFAIAAVLFAYFKYTKKDIH